jgi:hypothetical protein
MKQLRTAVGANAGGFFVSEVVAAGRLVVAIAFAEKGLKGMLIASADDLDVRTQRGQWWPGWLRACTARNTKLQ